MQRRRFNILLLFLLPLLVMMGLWIRIYATDYYAMHHFLAAQEAALQHRTSATQVVGTDDPLLVRRLIAEPLFYRELSEAGSPTAVARLDPDILEFHRRSEIFPSVNVETGGGTVFLHQRQSPAGHIRLVYVSVQYNTVLCTQVITPGTSTTPPRIPLGELHFNGEHHFNLVRQSAQRPMTFYAAQPDPADASHFTIPFDFGGDRHIIDGYLRDNDTVLLNPHLGYKVTSQSGNDESFSIDLYAINSVTVTSPLFTLNVPLEAHLPSGLQHFLSCAFSPDGKKLAVASPTVQGRLELVDAVSGKTLRDFHSPDTAYAMHFSPDGAVLEARNYGWIRRWNAATGDDLSPKTGPVRKATEPAGSFVLPYGQFGVHASPPPSDFPNSVELPLPDWQHFATYYDDHTNPAPGMMCVSMNMWAGQIGPPGAVHEFSPDRRLLAVPSPYGVKVFNVATGQILFMRAVKQNGPRDLGYPVATFSPDGRYLTAAVCDHGLCLWLMPDGKTLFDFTLQPLITYFAFSGDGKLSGYDWV